MRFDGQSLSGTQSVGVDEGTRSSIREPTHSPARVGGWWLDGHWNASIACCLMRRCFWHKTLLIPLFFGRVTVSFDSVLTANVVERSLCQWCCILADPFRPFEIVVLHLKLFSSSWNQRGLLCHLGFAPLGLELLWLNDSGAKTFLISEIRAWMAYILILSEFRS